jgi:hypothetical protein
MASSKSLMSTWVLRRRAQRGLVHQVGQVGADESGGALRDHGEIDLGGELHPLRVHPQDGLAALAVGSIDQHLAIEPPGAQECRIEHLGPVGGGEDDDALRGVEPVHLDQQLIERVLPLVVSAHHAGEAARLAEGIELVDEHDARRPGFGLGEQVADARRAHADEELDELRSADREEGDVGFAGDGLREQGLAGPRRADQQDPLRQLAAENLELLGPLEELDDLLELLLRLVGAGDVGERDAGLLLGVDPRPALGEGHDTRARSHPPHREHPDADEDHRREHP